MEHATGIEPAYSAWEADVLPLNYACIEIIKAQSGAKKKSPKDNVTKEYIEWLAPLVGEMPEFISFLD